MGTINSAFSIIAGALDADQSALNITASNVANASTPGYTREVPNWQENPPVQIGSASYGAGVTQTGPTSIRDNVLTERINQQQQLASASGSRLTALDSLQALFTPNSGASTAGAGNIGGDITSFFDSLASLEASPASNSLRQGVLSAASTLAADISGTASSLSNQRAAIDQEAQGVPSQVNALTSSIAQLNQQIMTTSPNADAGTLEDQRQQDLNQLSKLVGINQIPTEKNGLTITTTSGALLVDGNSSFAMSSGVINGVSHFYIANSDQTAGLTSGGGELGGYLTARDVDIPNVTSSLDQLAYSVSTQINALNNAGTDLDGNTGSAASPINIFSQPTTVAGAAIAMKVVMTNPNQIAAASQGQGSGSNSNAQSMADLGKQSITNGQTPSNFYASLIAALGSTVSEVQTESSAQNASVTQLQTQSNSLSGVNLNDEASSMTTLERSYQAASQVFTMLNSIIGSAINLGEATAVS